MSYPAGTLNIKQIQETIYQWAFTTMSQTVGSGRVIWRNQSEPLPARPCITLKIIDGPRPVGRSANIFQNPDGTQNVAIQQEMTLSVQIFGNSKKPQYSALQLGLDLNSSLLRQTVLDELKIGGAAVQQVGDLKNLTALEESQYEERSAFEIVFGLVQNISDTPGTIETINAELDVDSHEYPFIVTLP